MSYLLIPFKSLKDLKNASDTIAECCDDCLSKGEIYMQDPSDMKVERFTLDELHNLEKIYGVSYYHFTTLVDKRYQDEVEQGYALRSDELDISSFGYLNKELCVSVYETSKYCNSLDSYLGEDEPSYEGCELRVSYKGNVFTLLTAVYDWKDMNYCLPLLFVNDKPVKIMDRYLINDIYSDKFINLELVQVCKTKRGFDIVLYIFSGECGYICVSLSHDLELLDIVNKEFIIDEEESKKFDFENFKFSLAKQKLLGG